MNRLLVNPRFTEATYLISRYLNDDLSKGFAAQNQLYDSVAELLSGNKRAVRDVTALKTPVYQADLSAIQRQLMAAIKGIKKDADSQIEQAQRLQKDMFDKMLSELARGQNIHECKITVEDIAEQVSKAVSEIDEQTREQIKRLFIQIASGDMSETA